MHTLIQIKARYLIVYNVYNSIQLTNLQSLNKSNYKHKMDEVVHDVRKKFDEEEINQCHNYF
jgi:hypothetical protein